MCLNCECDNSSFAERRIHLMTALPRGIAKKDDIPTTHGDTHGELLSAKLVFGEGTAGTTRCSKRRRYCRVRGGGKEGGEYSS
jgi:hypothetical protein